MNHSRTELAAASELSTLDDGRGRDGVASGRTRRRSSSSATRDAPVESAGNVVRRWVLGLGTVAFGVMLLALALPRLVAHLHLLPGNEGLERILVDEVLTPDGYERVLGSREAALAWMELPEARIQLGAVKRQMAMHWRQLGIDRDAALREARAHIERGLAQSPLDLDAWLWLTDIRLAQGEREGAAKALRMAYLSAPYDVVVSPLRATYAFRLWAELDPATRGMVAHDVAEAINDGGALAFIRTTVREGSLAKLREAARDDPLARATVWGLLRHQDEQFPRSAGLFTIDDYRFMLPTLTDRATFDAYLSGIRDGLNEMGDILRGRDVQIFCPEGPDDESRDAVKLRALINRWAQTEELSDPAVARNFTISLPALQGLAGTYPCGEDGIRR